MFSLDEKTRAQHSLQAQAPAPADEAGLRHAEEEAAALFREARSRDPLASEKPVESVIHDLSESYYYQYLLRRRHRGPTP